MDSKLKSVRAGHKGAVTKLLVKFDKLKSKTDTEVDEVKALDDAVTQKLKTLIDLNNRLLEQTSEENLEQEITDSDEYMYELDCKIRQIRKFIKSFEHVETHTIISHDTVGPSTSRLNPDAYHFTPEARVDMNRCAIDSMKSNPIHETINGLIKIIITIVGMILIGKDHSINLRNQYDKAFSSFRPRNWLNLT